MKRLIKILPLVLCMLFTNSYAQQFELPKALGLDTIKAFNPDSVKIVAKDTAKTQTDTTTAKPTQAVKKNTSKDTTQTASPRKTVQKFPLVNSLDAVKILKEINLLTILEVLILIFIAVALSRLIDLVKASQFVIKSVPFFKKVSYLLKILIWIIICYVITLLLFGNPLYLFLMIILIVLTIAGVAALPAFRNIVGGFFISMNRPFEEGDYIIIESYKGKVIECGWKSTTLETDENSRITVPNSLFLKKVIENVNVGQKEQLVTLQFEFGMEKDVFSIMTILKEAALAAPYIFNKREVKVFLKQSDFINNKNIYELSLFIFDKKYENELIHSINRNVLTALKVSGEK